MDGQRNQHINLGETIKVNKLLTVASIQMFVRKEKNKNLEEIDRYLSYINRLYPQINMVVFPEFSITDMVVGAQAQAEEIPGKLTDILARLAKKYGIWLIPGSMYERSGNNIYNTSVVFSPQGKLIGKYRKRYPWFPYEKTNPGKNPFVFTIKDVGTIGIMICYDLWFPEVARDLVNLGAELIVVPTMTTTGDRAQEKIISQATAIVQQCYLVSCNGVGYGGVGGSIIVDPDGNIVQDSDNGPFMQTAIIDFDRVRMLRENGVVGVSHPWKDFQNNIQEFSVYTGKEHERNPHK